MEKPESCRHALNYFNYFFLNSGIQVKALCLLSVCIIMCMDHKLYQIIF